MEPNDNIMIDVNFNKVMAQFEYKSLSIIRFFRIKLHTKPKKICDFSSQSKKENVEIKQIQSPFLTLLYFFLKVRSHTFLCSFKKREKEGRRPGRGGGKKEKEEHVPKFSSRREDVILLDEDTTSKVNF